MLESAMPIASIARRHILVRGIVQGVGFRPFVFKLAESLSLTGHVFNSSAGVTIEVEGQPSCLDDFVDELRANPPALAEVTSVIVDEIEPRGDLSFSILHSHQQPGAFALISPDTGTCDACWRDVGDTLNRRFGYPFTNCTHCGPRYTIIRDIPYDRALTTMAAFVMCPACAAEYADPRDRRFHAQPNACPACGPALALLARGESLSASAFNHATSLEILRQLRALLREGRIVAIKGLGGFLLACDATSDTAVAELRRRKRRPAKPFALMVRDLPAVRNLCELPPADEAALTNPRRPIVVMPRLATAPLAAAIAPGNDSVGVMLPYTPLHYLLFSDSPSDPSEFPALVMTSGNLSEEPIITSNEEALRGLNGIADYFLLHNRDIHMRVDDSVVRTFEGRERVLRRARGYVPLTIDLGSEMTEVLGFGAELKNTFCLTKGRFAILSQHIGDLENYETEQFFAETLARMQHLFKVEPRAVAHDLHPGYRSTRLALASAIDRKFAMQHHHAHIASCMAENHLRGDVIGVAFDGTGYGTDGCIWGGEFLIANLASFTRRAHLRYVPLPGGDAAVRQPWRMALAYLRDAFGSHIPTHLRCFESIPAARLNLVDTMLIRRLQTVDTSSAGRLFDAVAALLGLASEITFEGQAAIALEAAAAPEVTSAYPFELTQSDPVIVDLRPTVVAIVEDLEAACSIHTIAARFHNTLCAAIAEVCSRIEASEGLNRVCLSGGTFQNLYLLRRTVVELRRRGFEVFLHATVPANDGGISLGQAVIANELLRIEGHR
jgi:hydrogenase maturation protein HypF